MISVKLTFPSGCYTAVQRGRNGRDTTLEWPPSPWTLLESLAEAWHRSLPSVSPEAFTSILESLVAGIALLPTAQSNSGGSLFLLA